MCFIFKKTSGSSYWITFYDHTSTFDRFWSEQPKSERICNVGCKSGHNEYVFLKNNTGRLLFQENSIGLNIYRLVSNGMLQYACFSFTVPIPGDQTTLQTREVCSLVSSAVSSFFSSAPNIHIRTAYLQSLSLGIQNYSVFLRKALAVDLRAQLCALYSTLPWVLRTFSFPLTHLISASIFCRINLDVLWWII